MENSNTLNNGKAIEGLSADFEALKGDLTYSWDTRNNVINDDMSQGEESEPYKRLLNSSNFVYSIDPGSMTLLKLIMKYSNKNWSISEAGRAIVSGKTLQFMLG